MFISDVFQLLSGSKWVLGIYLFNSTVHELSILLEMLLQQYLIISKYNYSAFKSAAMNQETHVGMEAISILPLMYINNTCFCPCLKCWNIYEEAFKELCFCNSGGTF